MTEKIAAKWIDKLEEWKILASNEKNGDIIYSSDDVIIARLIVNMDALGFGPKDGYDPSMLSKYNELFSNLIDEGSKKFIEDNYKNIPNK